LIITRKAPQIYRLNIFSEIEGGLEHQNLSKKKKNQIESLYTRLIAFRVSRVSGAHLRWQRVGDLIGSEFEPHTSRTRSERLTTCNIFRIIKRFLLQFLKEYWPPLLSCFKRHSKLIP